MKVNKMIDNLITYHHLLPRPRAGCCLAKVRSAASPASAARNKITFIAHYTPHSIKKIRTENSHIYFFLILFPEKNLKKFTTFKKN